MNLEKAFSNVKAWKHFVGKKQYHYVNRLMRDNQEIFTTNHLHYEAFHPETNDGLDGWYCSPEQISRQHWFIF